VLKALEKDPARRYAAASAFGEDIGHFLANRPVLARPPSTTYTIRKLVARHKAAAALGASLAIVLVAFAVAMSVMFARQRVQTLKAERVGEFLEEMLASPDPSNARGEEVLVRDVLNDASDRVRTDLREEPAVQAALQRTMARTYLSLGLSAQADSLARESVATLERIHGPRGHRETAASRRLLGDVLFQRGDYGEAESVLRRTLAEHRAVFGVDHEETAASIGLLGDVLNRQGEYEEAEKHLREGLRILGGTAGRETSRYATMAISLGTVLRSLGRYPETEALLREALQIQREVLPEDHPDVTRSMNELAMVLRHEGKFDEAESLYREAPIDEQVLRREHPLTAQLMANLGVLKSRGSTRKRRASTPSRCASGARSSTMSTRAWPHCSTISDPCSPSRAARPKRSG
jgi:tetratricopeptide (TPR) repeat protein